MTRAREGLGGRAWTSEGRGKDRSIDMLGRRQVTPRWEDNPMQTKTDVGVGGDREGGGCTSQKDIG